MYHITAEVANLIPFCDIRYETLCSLYIVFVLELRQVYGFLCVIQFPSKLKLTVTILLK